MCRWLAYSGSPVSLEDLLYKPEHSLLDQSLHARLGPHTTNGDGFGIGWYQDGKIPALFKGTDPIWNDQNLREISRQVHSGLIFAHIRAATGTPVQFTNCHPFRYGKWLWMHNGQVANFQSIKRELVMAIDPALYPEIRGSSDTEIFFFLALTLGLEQDPPAAVERAVGFFEQVGRGNGAPHPMRMSVATSDGTSIWGFRYSSEGLPPSLYFSTDVGTLRVQYPDVPEFQQLSEESRLLVSEPLGHREGVWNEVPASSYGVIRPGKDEIRPFRPVT
jgi:glutamine amidotransferase